MDKSTLYKLSYGLYAIGVQKGACIVNTVFQITSSPEVIALSMNKDNATHGLIKEPGALFGIHPERGYFARNNQNAGLFILQRHR